MLQTAEGGLNQIHSILGRMRELAVQSASDGLNADDRASIDLEFQQLKSEISRIGNGTEYNGMTLINGDRAKNLSLPTDEVDSIGGNMVNDSTIGKTKVASFAANGDYTLQAQKPDGSGGFTAATTLAEATQFTLTVGSESQTVVRAGDEGNGFNDVDGSQINFDELGIVTDTSGLTTGAKSFSVDDGNYMTIQVGANNDADHSAANPGATENRITFNLADATSEGLAIDGIDLDSLGDAQSAINSLDAAIQKVNDERSNIGALQNRFENTSSSLSTIQDADFAIEAADLARNQILTQSSSAMLAQANQISQNVLGLLR